MKAAGSLAEDALLAEIDRFEARFHEVEPRVHAFVPEPEGELNRWQRVRREARALVARYPDPLTRPPLFGALVGVKDVFHARGFPTGGGSRLPPEELAPRPGEVEESPAVSALREAGALILGKTVSTEFAFFAPGPTENPHAPGHTPGGSSSGSAAAVGAGLCPLALGTQTVGSVGRPAAFCGVVGFKPSYDRISRDGLIALAPSLDHVGVLARDVEWARRAAAVMIPDWDPPAQLGAAQLGAKQASDRPVLGIPAGPYLERATAEGRRHFEAVTDRLAAHGYAVIEREALTDYDAIHARHYRLLAAENARVHGAGDPGGRYARFSHLLHPRTRELIEEGMTVPQQEEEEAQSARLRLRQELTSLMDGGPRIDLWLTPPATGPAPQGLESTGDPAMNLPWTQAGLPTLVLPAGRNPAGLPLGLQLVARFGQDETLLRWGAELEGSLDQGNTLR